MLGHYFYNGKHFVWLSAEYFPYRLSNPKSSNPHLIYQDLYQPWKDADVWDKFVLQSRLNLRKGVIAQEYAKVITPVVASELKTICDKVDICFFYPLVYKVDLDAAKFTGRLHNAGSGVTAGSSEYLVKDLNESEFEIIFLDFDTDSDFNDLVIAGQAKDPMAVLKARC